MTVGGFYNHMPLGVCTSPSAALLSHYLGRPPYEALYLLSIHDCVVANLLTNPLVPPIPSPAPVSAPIFDPTLPTPKRRGRPPAFQANHSPLPIPPSSLQPSPPSFQQSPSTSINPSIVSFETITRIETQMAQVFNRLHSLENQVHSPTTSASADVISSPMANIGNLNSSHHRYVHLNPLQNFTPHTRKSPPDRSAKQTQPLDPTQHTETKTWTRTNPTVPPSYTNLANFNVLLVPSDILTKTLINSTSAQPFMHSRSPIINCSNLPHKNLETSQTIYLFPAPTIPCHTSVHHPPTPYEHSVPPPLSNVPSPLPSQSTCWGFSTVRRTLAVPSYQLARPACL